MLAEPGAPEERISARRLLVGPDDRPAARARARVPVDPYHWCAVPVRAGHRLGGVSHAKARALVELGRDVASGALDLVAIDRLGGDEARLRLTTLRGIGPWSADMFLLHELRRPGVFPAGDTGLRAAIAVLDDPSAIPSAAAAANRAVAWRPYRSYAAGQLSLSIRRHADV